jgi:hypothetical protein
LQDKTSGNVASQLSALLAQAAAIDPDLVRIIDAWPVLPAQIRAAVLALIQAGR